jgi:16S rRNA (cytidine1402-2'-O)-methyltransferase
MKNKIGNLFIIATPIGNLADITLRALETLKKMDIILCEDTRVTNILLRHYDIKVPLLVYNDHSDNKIRQKIINKLQQGNNLALLSDAGTPLISDPGYKLIKELRELGINIHTLPGPCSVIAALTLAAMPTDRFIFVGFLPHKLSAKTKLIEEIRQINSSSLVFFESANRLIESLIIMKDYFFNRQIAVVREITKLFEETVSGTAEEIIDYYKINCEKLKGEIVIVVAPADEESTSGETEVKDKLKILLEEMSLKDAVSIVSEQYNLIAKKNIYKMALELKQQ